MDRAVSGSECEKALTAAALAAIPGALLVVAPGGIIRFCNRAAESLFGYDIGALAGESIEQLVPGPLREGHARLRAAFSRQARERTMGGGLVVAARRHDGSEFPAMIALKPAMLAGESVITALVRDVSEGVESEQAMRGYADSLARANAELERFAAAAAHDINEPLRAIAGYCTLALDKPAAVTDGQSRRWLEQALDGATRLRAVVDGLLRHARSAGAALAVEPVAVDAALANVRRDLDLLIARSAARIAHDPLPTVEADPALLEQLLRNLLANALQYRGESPPFIHLAYRRHADHHEFALSDNGIGIEPDAHERIFEIFGTLPARSPGTGVGIGLAVCKTIVARHGGEIWVNSAPGAGATFHFTLPVRDAAHPLA